jgi:hypothetical protein
MSGGHNNKGINKSMKPVYLTTLVIISFFALVGCSTEKKCTKLVQMKCGSCHSIKNTCEQVGKSKEYWETTVDQMIRLNASISDSEKKTLVRCLGNSSKNLSGLCEM